MTVVTEYGSGYSATVPGDNYMAGYDRSVQRTSGKRGMFWGHGGPGSAVDLWDPAKNWRPLMNALASELGVIFSNDGGGTLQAANNTAQACLTDAWGFMKANYGVKNDKLIVGGVSMGGGLAVTWARNNPALVAAIVVFYPAVNMQAGNYGTQGAVNNSADIIAAYGGYPPPGGGLAAFDAAYMEFWQPLTFYKAGYLVQQNGRLYSANADFVSGNNFNVANWTDQGPANVNNPAALANIPMYVGISDNDTVAGTQNQVGWLRAIGGSALTGRVYHNAPHADATFVDVNDVASWVRQYV